MIIRKEHIVVTSVFIMAVIATILCAIYIPVSNTMVKGVVVIDAGHGGMDGGVSYGNMIEANINLELSRELKGILEDRGYKIVMTRDSTNSLGGKKKDDMQKRKEIILKAKPDIVVSIHVNKYQDTKRRGVQVFYDDTKKNKEVGERFQYLINSNVNKKYAGRDDLKSLGGDYFICKCSPYPSVIIECGFISNEGDRMLLNDSKYKTHLMSTIADGIDSMMLSKVSA
ncbi:MAG: N-acetylmuramoyl-L-alanine amidase [Clostridia bacterium]|nr:N-acetylmuramoyl-L-alanine amidase [Clostridia bacterium]